MAENPDEWLCECMAANPITRGRCWLCDVAGKVKQLIYWPPEPKSPGGQ